MRKRTAKQLGTRHDLNYFKAWTRQKRYMAALALGVPALLLAWLGVQAIRGESAPYSSGQMSRAHAVLSKQCGACHTNFVGGVRVGGFRKHAEDQACLACHQAPAHHAEQPFTPSCGSCHTEHDGSPQLAHTKDSNCTQCHADLRLKNGPAHFETAVLSFASKHPEFSSLKSDPGKVAFNHAVHMKAGLIGAPGVHQERVQLECSDCHRPTSEAAGPWRFGSAKWQKGTEVPEAPARTAGRAYMAPVAFDKHCIACHTMPFDKQVAGSAPHGDPETVHTFVTGALREYLMKNPNAWKPGHDDSRKVPGIEKVSLAAARSSDEWLRERTVEDENLLWRKTCKQCHEFRPSAQGAPPARPQVVPSAIPSRWFKHATFDHASHGAIRCDSCHANAATSQLTSDVLVPGIESCRTCHSGKGSGSADSGCFECHQYHDWKQRKPFRPVYSIPQITGQAD